MNIKFSLRQAEHNNQRSVGGLVELFKSRISTVETVSFDLFDTLAYRHSIFSSKDLYLQVQAKFFQQTGVFLDKFPVYRIRAENIARFKAHATGSLEITLHQIYDVLSTLRGMDEHNLADLKKCEMDCDLKCLRQYEYGRKCYDIAKINKKTILISTDTYYPTEFIKLILDKLEYADVSCVFRKNGTGVSLIPGQSFR